MNCNIALIGSAGVGKTSYINRLITGEFSQKNNPTMKTETRSIEYNSNKGPITFNIFDIDGKDSKSLETADAVIIMFDVTNRTSYKYLESWIAFAKKYASATATILVVGNKCDVASHEAARIAAKKGLRVDVSPRTVLPRHILIPRQHGLQYFDISAKSCFNYDRPLLISVKNLYGEDIIFEEPRD